MKYVVGNWKMNLLRKDAVEYLRRLSNIYKPAEGVEVVICPPYTVLETVAQILKTGEFLNISLGAQNAHWLENGPHTGEVSTAMLKELGVEHVIIGHSERRTNYNDSDETVALRAKAVLDAGMHLILCIGETRMERDLGKTEEVLDRQLRAVLHSLTHTNTERLLERLIIAYEPVWAIGTGLTPTADEVSAIHSFIKKQVYSLTRTNGIAVIYGGSVTPENASEFFSQKEINGALPGGASLDPEKFNKIVEAASEII
jgi:triosephosphate isomerase